jgi:hypothetical protein
MPLNNKGKFHMNPQMGKAAEGAPNPPPIGTHDAMKPEAGGKGHVELHEGPGPEGKGKFRTVHQPSGEVKSHETIHEAHHAMNEHMGQDGCSDGTCAEHGGSRAEGAAESTDDEY